MQIRVNDKPVDLELLRKYYNEIYVFEECLEKNNGLKTIEIKSHNLVIDNIYQGKLVPSVGPQSVRGTFNGYPLTVYKSCGLFGSFNEKDHKLFNQCVRKDITRIKKELYAGKIVFFPKIIGRKINGLNVVLANMLKTILARELVLRYEVIKCEWYSNVYYLEIE